MGRITDFYKARDKKDFAAAEDPGVLSVARIFRYYKAHGHKTVVMGASFRSTVTASCMRMLCSQAGR